MMRSDLDSAQPAPRQPFHPRTHVTIQGRHWLINDNVIHPASPAEGLLTNVRMVNAIFEDTGPAAGSHLPANFDPAAVTQRFIDRIPEYVAHGAIAFTISLQGGLPGYEGAINSAFNADGTLRDAYMQRAARAIEACDRAGAAVILSCFYQRQHFHDRALAGRDAIRHAVTSVVRWVHHRGYRNVLLEISNEYRHSGYLKWKEGEWLASEAGQVELIQLTRQAAPDLLVSTSGMGSGAMAPEIAGAADFLLIHFNNTALEGIPQRIAEARRFGKPVVCNEDDKVGTIGAEAARVAIAHGCGWGLMLVEKNQHVPFVFGGPADDPEVYAMLRRLTSPPGTIATAPAARATAPAIASVMITQPRDGDTFQAGQSILVLSAVTFPPGQPPARVEFLANNRPVAAASAAPWQVLWHGVPVGSYDLVAVQRDAKGRELARSRVVDIIVNDQARQ